MNPSLYHVSHVASGSMLGPPVTRYERVEASSASAALEVAARRLGNPEGGVWNVQEIPPNPATIVYARLAA